MVEENKIDNVNDAAASFQQAVVSILVSKTIAAAMECGACQILLSGGVASNRLLRQRLCQDSPMPVLIPPPVLCTDNAAMIAACGYFRLQAGVTSGMDIDVIPGFQLAKQPLS